MQIAISTIKYSAVSLLCSLFLSAALPGHSATGTQQGVSLYKQGKYAEAAKVFEAACRNPAADPNTLYYYALTSHQLGNYDKAKSAYQRVVQQYPGSPAGRMAAQALSSFAPGGRTDSGYGSTPGGATENLENLPEQARVYYTPSHSGQIIVDGYINNRQIKMLFDTGAESCAFGKNHLKELGIPAPTGIATSKTRGVGDSGLIDTWNMTATIKVGNIERKNVPISVQEVMVGDPLLGQTFFKDFTYTIDSGSNTIQFNRKKRMPAVSYSRGSSSSGTDRNSIPFLKVGNTIMVTGFVNGKSMQMIFDTGADHTVFAYADMKNLGIVIPDDAQEVVQSGVAGDTTGVMFKIQRMIVGPIDRADFNISVLRGFEAGHPLIGRSFLGEWQYTIDNDAKIIHFLRR
jgi:clan AA aspartic protease (TIGR02281 family)